ncbi:class E sortase [Streptomyces sp. NPDC101191]|uniref:class E sortase n=1 Tax=Streptomyces sp. NPDC101191 TaxID=3366126 RepID=UPI0037FFCB4C
MRGRIPVVVQARGPARRGRGPVGRALFSCAEGLVTCGVLLVLLVAHQLWWTNEQARAEAGRSVRALEREWDASPPVVSPSETNETNEMPETPGVPGAGEVPVGASSSTGQGGGGQGGGGGDRDGTSRAALPGAGSAYAVLRIPRIGLTVPVAAGVGKRTVLDRGYVGHYPGTAAPGRTGNFALAGHRNTHGEPFRYINRLQPGDTLTVRTRDGTFTYRVDRVLPQTSARDTGVVQPVPRSLVHPSYGYDRPGAYLTLTTCTPEFTSRYRLVVWAKLVSG